MNQFQTQISKLTELSCHKTPFYAWDTGLFTERVNRVYNAFRKLPKFKLLYSVKANPSSLLLKEIAKIPISVDTCSVGEIKLVTEAGFVNSRINICPFSPSVDEMEFFHSIGCQVDLDSFEDAIKWSQIARQNSGIGLRVNPDVKAGFHHHCASGVWHSKFGIPIQELESVSKKISDIGLRLKGIHLHIGSSSYNPAPYLRAIEKVLKAVRSCKMNPEYLNIGGGWGVPFHTQDDSESDPRFPLEEFAESIHALLIEQGMQYMEIQAEPGEYLVGPCGFLVCTVRRTMERRKGDKKVKIAILDGGFYLYPGPSNYGSDNFIHIINREEKGLLNQKIVGRSMFAGDNFGPTRKLPIMREGDIVAIGTAGAYSLAKAFNFNSLSNAEEYLLS